MGKKKKRGRREKKKGRRRGDEEKGKQKRKEDDKKQKQSRMDGINYFLKDISFFFVFLKNGGVSFL